MNAITFAAVTQRFGGVTAVDAVDLEIEAGRTVALLGANGAGKSTSIALMLGLTRPTTGNVRIFDETPDAAVAAGAVGAMLQDGALVPGLTVRETVDFVRGLYPDPLPLAEVLELTGLTDIARRRTTRLSGGQARRVDVALAIAGGPRLLILDEPTTALDVEARRAFWTAMRSYAGAGRTVLFATHYLEEADENADRIVVLARGGVAADGTPAQIKSMVGGATVSFTLGTQSVAGLDLLPGVNGVRITGETAALTTLDPDATVQALYRTDLTVRDLRVTGADLEDAFLALTGEQ
jgi:ABC-2 type transport system ATP-binding protein